MTAGPACEACTQPVADQAYLCSRCTGRLRGDLVLVVDLAGEVESAIARLVRYGGRSGGRDDHPLPVDLVASERAAAIGNTVSGWARHVAESRGLQIPVPRVPVGPLCRAGFGCRHDSCTAIRERDRGVGVAIAAAWLASHLEWLRHQRESAQAVEELHDAAADLRRLVGGPLPRWYAGPCWAPVGEAVCQEELYVAPGAKLIRCRACGASHDSAKRRDWLLAEARETLAHASLLAAALTALDVPVAVGTVYSWANRGRIVAHGHDQLGRPLYKVGEAMDLLTASQRRERGSAA